MRQDRLDLGSGPHGLIEQHQLLGLNVIGQNHDFRPKEVVCGAAWGIM
jgi:hypothetical protein